MALTRQDHKCLSKVGYNVAQTGMFLTVYMSKLFFFFFFFFDVFMRATYIVEALINKLNTIFGGNKL